VFHAPKGKAGSALREAAADQLDQEILEEKVASLTRAGRRVEAAIADIAAYDAGDRPGADRHELVNAAAREVWAFLIQREMCGLRDEKRTVEQYRIPREVMIRVGIV
jgi:hypothetical protein